MNARSKVGDRAKVKLNSWQLRERSSFEAGCFTGKTIVEIEAPATAVLRLVSRPDQKVLFVEKKGKFLFSEKKYFQVAVGKAVG